MDEAIHEEMTREALGTRLSSRALANIIAANLKQDSWIGLLGHDEYHFDNNAFDESYRYINEQRGYVLASLLLAVGRPAWTAFGRLTHSVQDFYAHTNYVSLWLDEYKQAPPAPPEIDPLRMDLIKSSALYSAKVYLPMDALYFVPVLQKLSLAFLPRDSHAWMNLDSPGQGPQFEYARAAAVKRTVYEFELLEKLLLPEAFSRFTDI